MIQGQVSDGWQPMVVIDLLDADGTEVPTSILVDTGYNGYLTLPRAGIELLQLEPCGEANASMADDHTITTPAYFGVAVWDEEYRPIVVLEGGSIPLAGMKLWRGCRLTVEAWQRGTVTIERPEK